MRAGRSGEGEGVRGAGAGPEAPPGRRGKALGAVPTAFNFPFFADKIRNHPTSSFYSICSPDSSGVCDGGLLPRYLLGRPVASGI